MATNGFAVQHWQFHLPKRGEKAEDSEDASAADPVRGRFAVADGAAGSSFSALWARLLVDEFVGSTRTQPLPWAEWLPGIQERWTSAVSARPVAAQKTPWFVEDRLQQGAFAAFLGVVLEEVNTWRGGKKRRWRVLAVGDACLFQVRQSQLYQYLPMSRSKDFGNTPWLVGSRTVPDRKFNRHVVQKKGDWQYDDRLWLMTDALALWFLQQKETGHKPWKELDAILNAPDPEHAFAAWVDGLRNRQALRNDDVTLLGVCL
jgi:hypothetical protein